MHPIIAKAARRVLRSAGLQRVRHPSFFDLIARKRVATVFDVGANDGHFAAELREAGFTGQIVSFEPVPATFERLKARSAGDARWDVYNLGLGEAAGALEIGVSETDVFSSFKPLSAYSASLWEAAKPRRVESVAVERLDTFLASHPQYLDRPYLKIDTQGFEMEVLRGAGERLAEFLYVQAELAFTQLYEGQHDWIEVVEWMRARGFDIALAKENGVDWTKLRLLEMDFAFERL